MSTFANNVMAQDQQPGMNLPAVAATDASGLVKVLKFVAYAQISPHESLIAQAFFCQAVTENKSWTRQKQAICYQYGISDSYLLNCLGKVKVFNTQCACIDCGRLYEIVDPCQGICPRSNVFHCVTVDNPVSNTGDTAGQGINACASSVAARAYSDDKYHNPDESYTNFNHCSDMNDANYLDTPYEAGNPSVTWVATGQWRCPSCAAFYQYGSMAEEAVVPF